MIQGLASIPGCLLRSAKTDSEFNLNLMFMVPYILVIYVQLRV
jgi:hypothetical protein